MKPLLTKPTGSNPYYKTKQTGGYSPCIPGNNSRGQRDPELNVLPNCVGWVTGRFNEIGGYGECRYLGNTDAKYYARLARVQGLKVTREPKLGGVMVWSSNDAGHVAVVEEIISPSVVRTSESEWYGEVFASYIRYIGDGSWQGGCYWMRGGYTYIGCINNPAVLGDRHMTYEEWKVYMQRYEAEKALQPADAWAEGAIERVKASGLMVGDAGGNFRPQSPIRREEMAAIIAGMLPDK